MILHFKTHRYCDSVASDGSVLCCVELAVQFGISQSATTALSIPPTAPADPQNGATTNVSRNGIGFPHSASFGPRVTLVAYAHSYAIPRMPKPTGNTAATKNPTIPHRNFDRGVGIDKLRDPSVFGDRYELSVRTGDPASGKYFDAQNSNRHRGRRIDFPFVKARCSYRSRRVNCWHAIELRSCASSGS